MTSNLELTITVVSWNTRELLRRCLTALRAGSQSARVVVHVVDNGSADGSPQMVREQFPEVWLTENGGNVGFACANNQSWRVARGDYWMLLNSDTEVRPGSLDCLLAFLKAHPRAGLVTPRLVGNDGLPQHCAQVIPSAGLISIEALRLHKLLPPRWRGRLLLGSYWTYDTPLQLGWTWGTALVARRAAVEQVGPLAEEFFMYGEDLEWCLRMRRAGWEIWFCPEAEVLHHGGKSAAIRWDDSARLARVLDGCYRALELHRGLRSTRVLQGVSALALSLQCLADFLRGHPNLNNIHKLNYHLGKVFGLTSLVSTSEEAGSV